MPRVKFTLQTEYDIPDYGNVHDAITQVKNWLIDSLDPGIVVRLLPGKDDVAEATQVATATHVILRLQ